MIQLVNICSRCSYRFPHLAEADAEAEADARSFMSLLLYHRLDGFFFSPFVYFHLSSPMLVVGSIATHAIAQLFSLLLLFHWNGWIVRVCVCLHLNTVFEFGKYEITTQIETFVWAFIFLLRLSCNNAVSWSQLHHNIMLVSLSFWNAHSEWIIFCFDFFFSLSNKTCNFAFVYTIRLSNHSIKKRMGARNWKQ